MQKKTQEEILAEERIQEAPDSNAKELNLVRLGLNALPKSNGQLDQLQDLFLLTTD